jgi:hypothetical protein
LISLLASLEAFYIFTHKFLCLNTELNYDDAIAFNNPDFFANANPAPTSGAANPTPNCTNGFSANLAAPLIAPINLSPEPFRALIELPFPYI